MEPLHDTIADTHEWVLDRVHYLVESGHDEDGFSLVQEFDEWLDPKIDDHDIYSLEYINGELEDLDDRG